MSIWNINEKDRKVLKLNNDLDLDILIIGAGLTGLNTAYYLQDKKNIAVVDANLYGHGVTLNSTAKITYLQDNIYTKIIMNSNIKKAKTYLKSQIDAVKMLTNIIDKEQIDCDLVKTPSYLFAHNKNEVKKVLDEVAFLKDNKINIIKDELQDIDKCYDAYKVLDTYTFNPIKYLDGLYNLLSKKIPIYENTKIVKIEYKNNKYYCYSNSNCITANKVILACHYPFFLLPFMLPIRGSIEKSHIIITKDTNYENHSVINTCSPIYSWRYYDDGNNKYRISLGQSHNITSKLNDEKNFLKVRNNFKINDEDIVLEYSNTDIISHDYIPYIGMIRKNMYIATGYNTWGMTNSILGAKIISTQINNNEILYDNIFNPKRYSISLIIKILINSFNQTKAYISSKLFKNKKWYDNVYFVNKNGKNLGIYIDKNGSKHIVYNKCPHLGCSLIFNEKEKTWDCPCHSSRFNMDGKCIKGPSTYDISYNDKQKEHKD